MGPLSYIKNLWADDDVTKPVSAARMSAIETGIYDAHRRPHGAIYCSTLPAAANGVAYEAGTTTGWTSLTVTEAADSEGWHPGSGMNPMNVRIGVAGFYLMICYVHWPTNSASGRTLEIVKNGGAFSAVRGAPVSNDITQQVHTEMLPWAVGDRLGMLIYQTSGSSITPVSIALEWALLSYI